MNLKDFKKVQEDDNKATFRNKRGHEFSVAKKALSKQHQEALKSLPLHANDSNDDKPIADPTEGMGTDNANASDVNSGNPVARYAGADESFKPDHPDKIIPGIQQGIADFTSKFNPPKEYITPQDTSRPETSENMLMGDYSAAAPTQPLPGAPDDSDNSVDSKPSDNQPDQPIAPAPRQVAQAPAPITPDAQKVAADKVYQDTYKKQYAASAEQRAKDDMAWEQDLRNGHVTPKTYADLFADKSTPGKIGTLFGLLLSGAGSGLAHQPNAVLQMMDNELNRDLQAQQHSKSNAVNYMTLAQNAEVNRANIGRTTALTQQAQLENVKLNATNKMMMAMGHQAGLLVDKIPANSPLKSGAVQALQGAHSAIGQKLVQNNDQMAKNEAAFKAKNESLRSMDMFMPGTSKLAESNEAHHISGYGNGSTNRLVSEAAHDEFAAKTEFDRVAKNYVDFAKKYGGLNYKQLDPRIVSKGQALAANLQTLGRAKNNGGVWKKSEQGFMETTTPNNPATWNSYFNSIPKMEQAIKDNEGEATTKASSYGINDFSGFGDRQGDQQPRQEIKPYGKKKYILDHVTKQNLGEAK